MKHWTGLRVFIGLALLLGAGSCGAPATPGDRAGGTATGGGAARQQIAAAELDAEWLAGASLAEFAEETQGRDALGCYLGQAKIGWAIAERVVGEYRGRAAAFDSFEMQFAMEYMGDLKQMRITSETVFSLSDGTILHAEEQKIDESEQIRTTVERRGDLVEIETRSGGRVEQRTVPLPRQNLDDERELALWLVRGPARGDTFESFAAAWDQLEVDDPLRYTFRESKPAWWFGVETEVNVLDLDNRGATTRIELAPDGTIVRGNIGPIELRAEDESTVKNMEISGIDLLIMIPLDRGLGDPRQVETLTLALEGIAGFDLPTSERQVLERTGDDSGILRVSRDPRHAEPVPLDPEERERFLAATPTHQAAHPEIVARARAIVGDETDPLARADRLQSWVFEQLRKDSNADSSTALDVLARKAGDCTEHTMLFVTLARAAGLPAREVGGIVYAEIDEPAFGWHAWAEIHDGDRWITVDPTWNQVFVDATHIKLRRDDDDMSFVNVMGRLRARVIEFSTSP